MIMTVKIRPFLLFFIVLTLLFLSIGCNATNTETNLITTTDMAGRFIEVPSKVDKVYCADPMSAITFYTLAPEKLLGWCYPLNDNEASYILEDYRDLPVFGMKDNINYEAVISAEPDIALLTGTINDALSEKADKMQERLGIPVIILDNKLFSAPDIYAFIGNVTGDIEQGNALSNYAKKTLDGIIEIPESERLSIYYANGIDSLNTSSKGSPASQIFDIVYADNVCSLPSDSGDRIQVTPEHVIDWNPSYIFVNGEPTESLSGSSAAEEIINNPQYANVQAVIDGNVISIPKSPFAWLDRPRSINRLIGINWLGSILYPEHYTFTNEDIKEFYTLFYHTDLTDDQLQELLDQ